MIEFVGVKFRPTGKVYNFLANQIELSVGDHCVVETERGVGFGTVDRGRMILEDARMIRPLKNVLRKATAQDYAILQENHALEHAAEQFCLKRVLDRGIEMQVVDVECMFDRMLLLFYFIAEGRIDFRDLVKDLAQQYKMRIEMRQIGVRDESKIIGGYGICGRPLCCTTFMKNFETVTIKMAKVQGVTLNPSKLSGMCDRLKCCLTYEYDYYRQMAKYLPRRGQMVHFPGGPNSYRVVEVNYLEGTVVVDVGEGIKKTLFYRDLERVE